MFSVLLYSLSKKKDFFIKKSKIVTLIVTTWFSLLAPLSWLIMFKAAAYIHTHTNFIAFYMPFALFGFAIIGIVLSHFLSKRLVYKLPKNQKVIFE